MHFTGAEWQTWFCQYLGVTGVPLPSMAPLRRSLRLFSCSCTWYDEYGDHINTCQKDSGNWHRTHNHLLACLQSLFFRDAGFSTRTHNIPRVTAAGNETIVGNLELFGANMGDPKMRNLIVDVSIDFHAYSLRGGSVSDFHACSLRDVTLCSYMLCAEAMID
jgi:hypothetical protein